MRPWRSPVGARSEVATPRKGQHTFEQKHLFGLSQNGYAHFCLECSGSCGPPWPTPMRTCFSAEGELIPNVHTKRTRKSRNKSVEGSSEEERLSNRHQTIRSANRKSSSTCRHHCAMDAVTALRWKAPLCPTANATRDESMMKLSVNNSSSAPLCPWVPCCPKLILN